MEHNFPICSLRDVIGGRAGPNASSPLCHRPEVCRHRRRREEIGLNPDYSFLLHKSQKSFTVAGPFPEYNADFRIMPNLLPSLTSFRIHSCLSTQTDA